MQLIFFIPLTLSDPAWKLGSLKFEGTEREGELLSTGIYADLEIYSLLKAEFRQQLLPDSLP